MKNVLKNVTKDSIYYIYDMKNRVKHKFNSFYDLLDHVSDNKYMYFSNIAMNKNDKVFLFDFYTYYLYYYPKYNREWDYRYFIFVDEYSRIFDIRKYENEIDNIKNKKNTIIHSKKTYKYRKDSVPGISKIKKRKIHDIGCIYIKRNIYEDEKDILENVLINKFNKKHSLIINYNNKAEKSWKRQSKKRHQWE